MRLVQNSAETGESATANQETELEYKTLILTEPTKYADSNDQVRNGNLIFTILPIQGAIEYHSECQLWK